VLPSDYPFVNDAITKKVLTSIMNDCMIKYGIDAIPGIVNKIKRFGFEYATKSGVSWSLDDVSVPEGKQPSSRAREKVARIEATTATVFSPKTRSAAWSSRSGTAPRPKSRSSSRSARPDGFRRRHGALRRSRFHR
jgi:hypothetical protein